MSDGEYNIHGTYITHYHTIMILCKAYYITVSLIVYLIYYINILTYFQIIILLYAIMWPWENLYAAADIILILRDNAIWWLKNQNYFEHIVLSLGKS